jgi:hypothetical protein
VAVKVSRLNPPSASVVQGSHPSQQYRPVVRVSRRSQSLQSIVRVTGLSQLSESAVRVSSQGSSSEATNNVSVIRVSGPYQPPCAADDQALSRPVRESISVDSVEQTPQPTHGTVPAMPVLSPAIRPVDPRRPKQRKRPYQQAILSTLTILCRNLLGSVNKYPPREISTYGPSGGT